MSWQALAADLREIMQGLEAMDASLTIAAGAGAASASMLADNAELNQFVLRVSSPCCCFNLFKLPVRGGCSFFLVGQR